MNRAAAAWYALGAIVLVGAWEGLVRVLDVRPFVLLPPSRIVRGFADDPEFFLEHAWVTARHLLAGIAIALAVAVTLGAAQLLALHHLHCAGRRRFVAHQSLLSGIRKI